MTVIPASNGATGAENRAVLTQAAHAHQQAAAQAHQAAAMQKQQNAMPPNLPLPPDPTGALMSMWSSSLLPMVQNQFNAFLFAQAAQAAAACLAASGGSPNPYAMNPLVSMLGQPGGPAPGMSVGGSKSPEELVNDVISNLSPAGSGAATSAASPVTAPLAATSQKHCPVRTYTCPHNGCGHETRETREHLHHLRDAHDERLSIFYCEYCTYASKTLAKVRRHASLIHRIDNHPAVSSPALPVPAAPSDPTSGGPGLGGSSGGINMTSEPHTICTSSESTESDEAELHKCTQCKYTTTDPARFKKHLRCHQCYGPTKCDKCDFTTVYAWNLDRHVKSHSVPGRFSCFRCSFSQNTRQSMSFHLQHHHIIPKCDVEIQTDAETDNVGAEVLSEMSNTAMGHEVFLFEYHAVKVNESYDPNAALDDHVPVTETPVAHSTNPGAQTTTVRKTPNATITVSDSLPKSKSGEKPVESALVKRTGLKKMLSESEIIESPAEPQDLREYEALDPDVRKRTCSICGYQGKWISEMVRHKRVHTNERPFKCKYCSRTSKWKADLIRHVAKAHGIKVISKYSRGGTIGNMGHNLGRPVSLGATPTSGMKSSRKSSGGRRSSGSDHLHLASGDNHLDSGNGSFMREKDSGSEVHGQKGELPEPPTLREAQLLEYFRSHGATSPSMAPSGTSSSDPDLGSNSSLSPCTQPGADPEALLEKYLDAVLRGSSGGMMRCKLCGFDTSSMELFHAHATGHENGPKPYACSVCPFRSNWSSDVHKHIRLNKATHESAYVVKSVPKDIPLDEPRRVIPGASRFACAKCQFTHEARTEVIEHLTNVHSLPAYGCSVCSFSSLYRKACAYHVTSIHGEPEERVIENMSEFRTDSSYVPKMEVEVRQEPTAPKLYEVEAQISKRCAESNGQDPYSIPLKKRKMEDLDLSPNAAHSNALSSQQPEKCVLCPYTANDPLEMLHHLAGHERPKTPFAYKCYFCPYYSRRKPLILAHMLLHTDDPDSYMPLVERNLVTPMSHAGEVLVNHGEGGGTHQDVLANTHTGSGVPSEVSDQPLDLSAKKVELNGRGEGHHSVIVPRPIRPEPVKASGLLLGMGELSDVFKEFEALLPQEECSPKPISLEKTGDVFDDSQISPALSDKDCSTPPWGRSDGDGGDDSSSELVPRTAEIQKVDIVVDGKESKVWQCRYCLHTSKRRANVRLHERKHFKRALKGASYCRCPQCHFQGPRDAVLDHMISEHSDNCHLLGKPGGPERVKTPKHKLPSIPKSMVTSASKSFSESGEVIGVTAPSIIEKPPTKATNHSPMPPKPKNHTCQNCPAKFTDRAQLMRHERFHGTDMRYKCHMCNYSVPFPINLTKHYKSHHQVGIIVTGNGTRQATVVPGASVRTADTGVRQQQPHHDTVADTVDQIVRMEDIEGRIEKEVSEALARLEEISAGEKEMSPSVIQATLKPGVIPEMSSPVVQGDLGVEENGLEAILSNHSMGSPFKSFSGSSVSVPISVETSVALPLKEELKSKLSLSGVLLSPISDAEDPPENGPVHQESDAEDSAALVIDM